MKNQQEESPEQKPIQGFDKTDRSFDNFDEEIPDEGEQQDTTGRNFQRADDEEDPKAQGED